MALITMCGFDTAGFAASTDFTQINGWEVLNGIMGTDITFGSTSGKFSGGALLIDADTADGQVSRRVTIPTNEIRMAFYVLVPSTGSYGSQGLMFMHSLDKEAWWNVYVSGGVIRSSTLTTAKTTGSYVTTTTIDDDAWHHVEIYAKFDTSAGIMKIWIDGSLEVDASGNTGGGTGGTYDASDLVNLNLSNSVASGSAGASVRFDDIVLWDDTGIEGMSGQIGAHRIYGLTVDGAGASTQFTPSAGSNFQNVDEAAFDGDSTYNSTTTNAHKDMYAYTALGSVSPDYVRAVCLKTVARATGINASFTGVIGDGTDENDGLTHTLLPDYKEFEDFFILDPGTDDSWIDTDVADVQGGIKAVI